MSLTAFHVFLSGNRPAAGRGEALNDKAFSTDVRKIIDGTRMISGPVHAPGACRERAESNPVQESKRPIAEIVHCNFKPVIGPRSGGVIGYLPIAGRIDTMVFYSHKVEPVMSDAAWVFELKSLELELSAERDPVALSVVTGFVGESDDALRQRTRIDPAHQFED